MITRRDFTPPMPIPLTATHFENAHDDGLSSYRLPASVIQVITLNMTLHLRPGACFSKINARVISPDACAFSANDLPTPGCFHRFVTPRL